MISVIYLLFLDESKKHDSDRLSVADALGSTDTVGYAQAISPREFKFPADHGPHPEFKTEWWYFTGNLATSSGRKFGYQFTIFRTAMIPVTINTTNEWSTNQVYMAHFAISDIDNKKFYHFERFARGNDQLAGAQAKPFKVWLEDWQIVGVDQKTNPTIPVMKLSAQNSNIELVLELENLKPPVLQGDNGLSQKGPQPGNASYYYSLTRIKSNGTLKIDDELFSVEGLSWLDREWSTSALGENQVGWDWFSLQLNDNTEIMYYQIRQSGNKVDPLSKGSIVFKDKRWKNLVRDDVQLKVLDYWPSPLGGNYPADWQLVIPSQNIDLRVTPVMSNQELDVSIRYWEGAVEVIGQYDGSDIQGNGYVELTGYAERNLP